MGLLIGVCSSQQGLVCDIWGSCVLMSVGCWWEVQRRRTGRGVRGLVSSLWLGGMRDLVYLAFLASPPGPLQSLLKQNSPYSHGSLQKYLAVERPDKIVACLLKITFMHLIKHLLSSETAQDLHRGLLSRQQFRVCPCQTVVCNSLFMFFQAIMQRQKEDLPDIRDLDQVQVPKNTIFFKGAIKFLIKLLSHTHSNQKIRSLFTDVCV